MIPLHHFVIAPLFLPVVCGRRDIIKRYEGLDRPWMPDVVGRARSNLVNNLQKQVRLVLLECIVAEMYGEIVAWE